MKKHTYEEGDINYEQKFEEFILAFRDGKDVDKLFPEFRKKKATYIDLGSLLYPFDK